MSSWVNRPSILVTAAVIERNGRFLVTRRPDGSHLAGCWEFPGGKCEAGETLESALAREIREELDAEVVVGAEILRTSHAYPERIVELRFFECRLLGEPMPQQGQAVRWVSREELAALDFPPADAELVRRLSRGPTSCEANHGEEGVHPGLPPIPFPGDEQREEGDQNNDEKHQDDGTGRRRAMLCSPDSLQVP